eukprot:2883429-Pleurochrysis_carterae.AAC.1
MAHRQYANRQYAPGNDLTAKVANLRTHLIWYFDFPWQHLSNRRNSMQIRFAAKTWVLRPST